MKKINKVNPYILLISAFVLPMVSVVDSAHSDEFTAITGAFLTYSPDYEGSDDYEIGGQPVLVIGWEKDQITPESDTAYQIGLLSAELSTPLSIEVGLIRFYHGQGLYEFNTGIAYEEGRSADDNEALRGMGDVDDHVIGSWNLAYFSNNHGWDAAISYGQDLSDENNGSLLDVSLGYSHDLSNTVSISTHVNANFADDDYMQSYFGVNATQARNTNYSSYDADAGMKSAGITFDLKWEITEHVGFAINSNYMRLTGDAADSPIVKGQGSVDQFSNMIGLAYIF